LGKDYARKDGVGVSKNFVYINNKYTNKEGISEGYMGLF